MSDTLVRIVSEAGDLRGIACLSTDLVNDACSRHRTSPTASAAFARALTGGALMSALVKGDQRLAIKFEGNGPIQKILVEADADGCVRGRVGNPDADLPFKDGHIDVAGSLGSAGLLTVIRDLGLKEPVSGTVHLVSGEIGEDLAYYFAESEQIPSAVGVGACFNTDGTIAAAGGFLIQSLPPANDSSIESITAMINAMPPLSTMLKDGQTPEAILRHIFAEVPYKILSETPVAYKCNCSRERFERGLLTLGIDELKKIANEDPDGILTKCEYCHEQYEFKTEDLEMLVRVLVRAQTGDYNF